MIDCVQVPIIAPIKQKKAEMLEQQPLRTNYSNEFLGGLMNNPELIRNIAVVGHLHHGKTLVSPQHQSTCCEITKESACFIHVMICPYAVQIIAVVGHLHHGKTLVSSVHQAACYMPAFAIQVCYGLSEICMIVIHSAPCANYML